MQTLFVKKGRKYIEATPAMLTQLGVTTENKPDSPMQTLFNAMGAQIATLAGHDGPGADWATGSMILGLANRAAFEATQAADRQALAGKLAAAILAEYVDGAGPTLADQLPGDAPEVQRREYRKHRSNALAFEMREQAYRAIYDACKAAWADVKGGVMPDQFKRRGGDANASDEAAKRAVSAW